MEKYRYQLKQEQLGQGEEGMKGVKQVVKQVDQPENLLLTATTEVSEYEIRALNKDEVKRKKFW